MKSGLAREDSSYRWVSPRGTKGVGTHEIIIVEYYIYLYILLLFRLTSPLWFFPSRNNILSKMHYFSMKFNASPECGVVVPPSGGFVGGPKNVTKTILFEPACQKIHLLKMNFNKS